MLSAGTKIALTVLVFGFIMTFSWMAYERVEKSDIVGLEENIVSLNSSNSVREFALSIVPENNHEMMKIATEMHFAGSFSDPNFVGSVLGYMVQDVNAIESEGE